ncbi:MAG: NAD(P)-dependent oxidoreductase [Prevotellaceae bacterium]|jgi:nucleoside-diphosphate-sugar epimerase|nr:NAD(P)-dependent oxidoreductase [Prevotellaceae bacterium]
MNNQHQTVISSAAGRAPKVLITGASGFVGSHLTDYALANGYAPCAGVRASSSRAYLQDPRIHFIDLPLADAGRLTETLRQCKAEHGVFDYVIHAAGIISAERSQFDRINFGFTRNLADALIGAGMTPKKFIYISSLSAFGPGDGLSQRPIGHDDTPRPNTAYGQSKLKAEKYLFSLPASFPFIILRPTGIYGPRDRGYLTYIKMVNNGLVPFLGRRPQYITFIHVRDLAKATFAACVSPLSRRAYFVADNEVYTTREYAEIIRQQLGKRRLFSVSFPLWFVKAVFYSTDRLYSWFGRTPASLNIDKYNILCARSWICDTVPLRTDLHFSPDYRLDEALREVIESYRQDGWLKN